MNMSRSPMITLHPQVIRKDGKEQFVVLPYEEFIELQERLADAEDVLELRRAKQEQADERTVPLEDVKRRLDIHDDE
jgi:hypothetical protein